MPTIRDHGASIMHDSSALPGLQSFRARLRVVEYLKLFNGFSQRGGVR